MNDVIGYGALIAVISVAGLLAVVSNRLSEGIRVPAPVIFLIVAAVVSDLVPRLERIPILTAVCASRTRSSARRWCATMNQSGSAPVGLVR